jgi:hypothetical protein
MGMLLAYASHPQPTSDALVHHGCLAGPICGARTGFATRWNTVVDFIVV